MFKFAFFISLQERVTGLSGFYRDYQEQTSVPFIFMPLPASANGKSPGHGFFKLRAFNVCLLTQEQHLKEDSAILSYIKLIRSYLSM